MTEIRRSELRARIGTQVRAIIRGHMYLAAALSLSVPHAAVAANSTDQDSAAVAADQQSPTAPADTANQQSGSLQEVVVTATRRQTSVLDVPFNVSAYSQSQLTEQGITSIDDLARTVPGLSMVDRGPEFAAVNVPIIRGLNISATSNYFQEAAEPPVTIYVGDVPVEGYLPLEDVQRVEVLRGPQGTLYGSGSLAGAVRIIPNAPQLKTFSTDVSAQGSAVDHAPNAGYRTTGIINVPMGQTVAFRGNVSYDETPGYIEEIGLLKRGPGTLTSSVPLLANPADIAGSPGIYYDASGVNYSGVLNARGAFLWQPIDALQVNLSYQHVHAFGGGRDADSAGYAGGADLIDPRITQPALGSYEFIGRGREPWFRESDLTALDASYDLGFATLTAVTGYFNSKGDLTINTEGEILSYGPALTPYYTGLPANPRFVAPASFADRDSATTSELRLVSRQKGPLEWIAGAFYMNRSRDDNDQYFMPGTNAQNIASGSPYVVLTNPEGVEWYLERSQRFIDRSIYADLTWHVTSRFTLSGGARQFWQAFSSGIDSASYTFLYNAGAVVSNSNTDHIFKLNGSYDLGGGQHVYATWSQGFRRGGANAISLTGPVAEPLDLLKYNPDKTTNYELGLKGELGGRARYTFDVFDIEWNKAQLDTRTPAYEWPVTINSNGARSRGVELETTFRALDNRLTVTLGGDYADAFLTRSFSLDADNGVPITGQAGERLPGAPSLSASILASYNEPLTSGLHLVYSGYGNYSGGMITDLTSNPDNSELRAYSLWGGSLTLLSARGWSLGLFGDNIFNTRAVYGMLNWKNEPGGEYNAQYVNRPREVGIRAEYSWD